MRAFALVLAVGSELSVSIFGIRLRRSVVTSARTVRSASVNASGCSSMTPRLAFSTSRTDVRGSPVESVRLAPTYSRPACAYFSCSSPVSAVEASSASGRVRARSRRSPAPCPRPARRRTLSGDRIGRDRSRPRYAGGPAAGETSPARTSYRATQPQAVTVTSRPAKLDPVLGHGGAHRL